MPDIVQRLATDFPGLKTSQHNTATVHRALGGLIRERKVYYAGAGYMLVVPELRVKESLLWPSSCCSSNNWSIKLRRDISCQTEPSQPSQPSLACWGPSEPSEREPRTVPGSPRKTWAKPRQIDCSEIVRPGETKSSSLLPDSRRSRALERSQSLRLSRVARVKIEKGGSLKLSKEDSAKLQKYLDSSGSGQSQSEPEPAPAKKPLCRRDSLISKFFSRRRSQKEMLVFSAQFPEENIYSEPRPPPPTYQSAPPYRPPAPPVPPPVPAAAPAAAPAPAPVPAPGRTSLSQLHLARNKVGPAVSPPARRSLKYSSVSEASNSSSPSSLSG